MRVFDSPIGGTGFLGDFAEPGGAGAPAPAASAPSHGTAVAAPAPRPVSGASVGSAFVVSAVAEADGSATFRRERNAALVLDDDRATRSFLDRLGAPFAEGGGNLTVAGEAAVEVARLLRRELLRPVRDGVLSAEEPDAARRIEALLARTVGRTEGAESGVVAYSLPSPAGTDADARLIYHRGIVEAALRRLGHRPVAIGEGLAVVLSELSDASFTGIGISFGAGRTSVCLAHRGIEVDAFSIARGGDWVDRHAATALSVTETEASALKERGIDLRRPSGPAEATIATLIRNLVGTVVDAIAERLAAREARSPLPRQPVALAVGGGSALAPGFGDVLAAEFGTISDFPFGIESVRVAAAPLETVARGCLVAASLADEPGRG